MSVGHVAHKGGAYDFYENIEGDDLRILEVLDGLALVNVELLLQEHGLQRVDAYKYKR